MYVESSGVPEGKKAWLLSPQTLPSTPACLEMWFHMAGSNVGSLAVYQFSQVGNRAMQTAKLWEIKGIVKCYKEEAQDINNF